MLRDLKEKQKNLNELVDVLKDLIDNDRLETVGCFGLCRGGETLTFISIGPSDPLKILGTAELLKDAVKQNLVFKTKGEEDVSD